MVSADFQIEDGEGGLVLHLSGDWTTAGLGRTTRRLATALKDRTPTRLDLNELGRFDTAGALSLERESVEPRKRADAFTRSFAKVGRGIEDIGHEAVMSLAFLGRLMVAAGAALSNPGRIRWPAWFSQAERSGLDALPIIATTNFFVGAVIAFLGADLLTQFGAGVFTVQLIGVSVLREFAVVITAVLLAGRSASSFAAEIGAMRMNQEIDAMQVMGVNPFQALVIPRLAAMLLMLPILTFVGMVSGLFGGMLVTWAGLLHPADRRHPGRRHPYGGGDDQGPGLCHRRCGDRLPSGHVGGGGRGVAGASGHRRRGPGHLRHHPAGRGLRPDLPGAELVTAPIHPFAHVEAEPEVLIQVRGLLSQFGDRVIHENLDLDVVKGEVLGIVGGSGSGKTVLLNTILGLKEPDGGTIRIFDHDITTMTKGQAADIEQRTGTLFQQGALFSSLTVLQNVASPLVEHTRLPRDMIRELAEMKIAMAGLGPEAHHLKPAELSGGMRKRVGLARALAPIGAAAFDALIRNLSDDLGLTVFMITHDLDSLYAICDKVAVLADKRVIEKATVAELEQSDHPWIKEYFLGPRGRAATKAA